MEHGSDKAYVFGSPKNGPDSVALSHNMIDYWISFATSLDPNDGLGNSSRMNIFSPTLFHHADCFALLRSCLDRILINITGMLKYQCNPARVLISVIQNVLELNSAGTLMIPDTFREDQISFLMENPEALLH